VLASTTLFRTQKWKYSTLGRSACMQTAQSVKRDPLQCRKRPICSVCLALLRGLVLYSFISGSLNTNKLTPLPQLGLPCDVQHNLKNLKMRVNPPVWKVPNKGLSLSLSLSRRHMLEPERRCYPTGRCAYRPSVNS